MDLISHLYPTDGFMPHGHDSFWNPSVLRLQIISDALITLAYLTIPITFSYVVRKRKDIPFDWIFASFGIFIVACGISHAMEIWSIWHPMSWLSGSLKAVTAAASLTTAVLFIRLIPQLLAISNTDILKQANRTLESEIGERTRAEEALRESELRFREMTEHIQKVFWMATPFGEKLIYISPAYERVWGRTCASLHAEPRSWIDGIVAEDRPMVLAALQRNAHGETYEIEYRVAQPDGSQRWVRDRGFPVLDHDGKVVRVCGIVEDITDRRAADAELRRLSRAVEQSPVSIVITDAACNIEYVNPKFVELTGYTAAEVLGKNPRILNSGQTPRQVYVELWAALQAGRQWRGEFLNRRKDGELFWELATISALRDAQGVTTHFVAVKEDITALKAAEAELRWKTAVHEAHVNSSLDGILIVDEHGKKILQNRKFGELWKIPREILDQDDDAATLQYAVGTTVHPERFYERVRYLYSHPDETSRDEIECQDGTVLDRYSSPVRDQDGKYYGRIWTFRDVTQRKRAEAALEKAHRELIAASRQAGMAEVATNVLHNVGNVLNSVNTSVDIATRKVGQLKATGLSRVAALLTEHADGLPAFFAEHPQGVRLPKFLTQLAGHFATEQQTLLGELAALRGNLEHINEIVAMQQSYAGAGGIVEVLPLAEVIGSALRLNTASFERHGTRVICEIDPALPPVAIDRHKLLLILINLVRNAKYACDEGGAADKRITVRAQLNGGGGAKISVNDNGIGIPPENLTRIFEHGFTTRKNGHGFGLHSSALAASEMGGSLRAQSGGPGQGATFTIELPLEPTSL